MKENQSQRNYSVRWKRFNNKGFSVFSSLKKEINIGVLTLATLGFANSTIAQTQQESPAELKTYALDEIEVTGSRVPLTQAESARMVTVLSKPEIQAAAVHSINDLLKYVTGVDVRQRGEFGIQTDISIRGGTFDQITVLLNGVNINNPQTGHLTTDFPVSMDDIERIEILEGPAARVFGTSAFNGAINIVTKGADHNEVGADLLAGGYGLFGAGARGAFVHKSFKHQISGNFRRSDGATVNSDFKSGKACYQGGYTSSSVDVNWQFGFSDQDYGANTFYSAKYDNQFEKTKRYITSIQAKTKGRISFTPTVYWNRSRDNFQLIKGTATGENFHMVDVYGANVNAHFTSILGKTGLGAEFRNEGILSTNLGKPLTEDERVKVPGKKDTYFTNKDNRTNISYYLEHNLIFNQFTASLGVMANMNTALDHKLRYYPGIDLSYRPTINWKIYASWNKALRMPTFTDLYYKSPTQEGNVGLKPEETQAYNIGVEYQNEVIKTSIKGFYHKGKSMIDWVMYNPSDVYHSANFELDNRGVELNAHIHTKKWLGDKAWIKSFQVGYSYIDQKRKDKIEIYRSNYALNYLKHKVVAQLQHKVFTEKLTFNWSFRWQDRMGDYTDFSDTSQPEGVLKPYPSFCLIDLKAQWTEKNFLIYAEANNLLERTYFDLGNIPQPGFWFKVGVKCNFRL